MLLESIRSGNLIGGQKRKSCTVIHPFQVARVRFTVGKNGYEAMRFNFLAAVLFLVPLRRRGGHVERLRGQ